jgi:hypothetical protein
MAQYNFFWKVWLRLNLLTKDIDNDYTAEVSTEKNTLRNEEIAQRIVDEGSEIRYDTLLSVFNQHDRIIRESVQQGYKVLTGVAQYGPRVTGSWIGSNDKFDPDKHKVTLDMMPSAEMREALGQIGVEVLGVKDSGAYIGLVTDTLTGATDGSITPGDDIRIEGDKIRIGPDGENGTGVFFVAADGTSTPVTRRLTQNDPKTLIARVPDSLASGSYTLQIVTRFSTSSIFLKNARTIEYSLPLIVK